MKQTMTAPEMTQTAPLCRTVPLRRLSGAPRKALALRWQYQLPVIVDEFGYEGDIEFAWGNLTARELVHRAWTAVCSGGWPTHGETLLNEQEHLWWAKGGELKGKAPERIRFLHRILSETPGLGLKRGEGSFDETVGVPDSVFANGGYEIHYYGFGRPSFRDFHGADGAKYRVQVIDTWGMTVEDVGVFGGDFRIPLPGREYMAIRLIRC